MALLVVGPAYQTLPRQMFAGLNDNINLTITAVATLLILVAVAILVSLELLRRRGERLRT